MAKTMVKTKIKPKAKHRIKPTNPKTINPKSKTKKSKMGYRQYQLEKLDRRNKLAAAKLTEVEKTKRAMSRHAQAANIMTTQSREKYSHLNKQAEEQTKQITAAAQYQQLINANGKDALESETKQESQTGNDTVINSFY